MYDQDEANYSEDLFKPVFKYFKRRVPPPDLATGVITEAEDCSRMRVVAREEADFASLHLRPPSEWSLLSVASVPGLYLVRNAFTAAGHVHWPLQCLGDWARSPPNRTNLDLTHSHLSSSWFRAASNDPKLLPLLRWATLGLHHDWNTKVYSTDSATTFPSDLASLAENIVSAVSLSAGLSHLGMWTPPFRAEAAIVNFYPMDATLNGHTDHSEQNLDAPLLSISFGQSAVFLIGGASKSVRPTAILLRSGDCVLMTGESRRGFHAVPRIVEDRALIQTIAPQASDDRTDFCLQYLDRHRININIRQVF